MGGNYEDPSAYPGVRHPGIQSAIERREEGQAGRREWRAAISHFVSKIGPGADDSRTHPRPGWIAREKRKELRGIHEGSVLGAVLYLPIFERMQSREEVVLSLRAEGRSLQGTYTT